jgi:myosin protein heavy chain
MDEFNRQLQEYLEGAMRAAAMEALLQRGGLESVGAGGSKATISVLRAELEQVKQVLAKGQEETKQEVQETKQEVLETKQEVKESKQELTVLSAVQEETKKEVEETKQEVQETKKEVQETKQRISALEGKIDTMLALLQGSGRNQ